MAGRGRDELTTLAREASARRSAAEVRELVGAP
jgi:hypothetical protein